MHQCCRLAKQQIDERQGWDRLGPRAWALRDRRVTGVDVTSHNIPTGNQNCNNCVQEAVEDVEGFVANMDLQGMCAGIGLLGDICAMV